MALRTCESMIFLPDSDGDSAGSRGVSFEGKATIAASRFGREFEILILMIPRLQWMLKWSTKSLVPRRERV